VVGRGERLLAAVGVGDEEGDGVAALRAPLAVVVDGVDLEEEGQVGREAGGRARRVRRGRVGREGAGRWQRVGRGVEGRVAAVGQVEGGGGGGRRRCRRGV